LDQHRVINVRFSLLSVSITQRGMKTKHPKIWSSLVLTSLSSAAIDVVSQTMKYY